VKPPPSTTPSEALARKAIALLRAAGHQAFLVGGCVRDMLLGLPPKDFDVSTDALPRDILRLFPGSGQVGAQFGVVLVRDSQSQVEVATFRSDADYSDGRRPGAVRFERDPKADVLRRDFTINGLMMDPETGRVLDYVDGRADLERRLVRVIGDAGARFDEDRLRLLRAVRFAARMGFEIEPATLDAIRRRHTLILKVAAERVRDELSRILTEGGARRGFELLVETGLLVQILPEVAAMQGVEQPPEFHPEGDVWTHTLRLLGGLDHPTLTLALSALLHDVGKPPTFRVADRIRFDGHAERGVEMAHVIMLRLRYPNGVMERVEALVANHMRFLQVGRMKESTLKRFLRMPGFQEHLELHRLDCLAGSGRLENYEFVRGKLAEYSAERLAPAPLLTGDGLVAAGYTPGPRFSRILTAVEDAQLEGRIRTAEEALAMVRREFAVDD